METRERLERLGTNVEYSGRSREDYIIFNTETTVHEKEYKVRLRHDKPTSCQFPMRSYMLVRTHTMESPLHSQHFFQLWPYTLFLSQNISIPEYFHQ